MQSRNPVQTEKLGLVLLGHGTRQESGVEELWTTLDQVRALMPDILCTAGFIEFAKPSMADAFKEVVASGATHVVGVPLVLLGAGHLKNDGASAVAEARHHYPGVTFAYSRPLGIDPLLLELASRRAGEAISQLSPTPLRSDRESTETAVILVGRGSTDPQANADLFKIARLLEDPYGLPGVQGCFVSLSPPSVATALNRCSQLGAVRIAVVPYFLFDGVLISRIRDQVTLWASQHPQLDIQISSHLGPDPVIAKLIRERFEEAAGGGANMTCDCCKYRVAMPGYESAVGAPLSSHH